MPIDTELQKSVLRPAAIVVEGAMTFGPDDCEQLQLEF